MTEIDEAQGLIQETRIQNEDSAKLIIKMRETIEEQEALQYEREEQELREKAFRIHQERETKEQKQSLQKPLNQSQVFSSSSLELENPGAQTP